jgi:hypothetical protein
MKQNLGSTLLSILILLVIAGAAYYIVQSVRQTTQQAVAPFTEANSSLQTQVADLLHPTPTVIPDPVTYINQIQALARLETIQYSVEQVVTAETNQGAFAFLVGHKMLLQVHGTVIAGIDMQKLQPADMQMQDGVLTVKLPPAEVFITTLDESKTQVYDLQSGIFAQPEPGLVLTGLVGAKDQILKAAMDDGILDLAQQNAESYLAKFFAALGYKNTIFVRTPTD